MPCKAWFPYSRPGRPHLLWYFWNNRGNRFWFPSLWFIVSGSLTARSSGKSLDFGAQITFKMAAENQRPNLVLSYLLVVVVLRRIRERRERRKHIFWVRKIFQKRKELGTYHTLVPERVFLYFFSASTASTPNLSPISFQQFSQTNLFSYSWLNLFNFDDAAILEHSGQSAVHHGIFWVI